MLGKSQNLDKPVQLTDLVSSCKVSIVVEDLSAKGIGRWGGAVRPFLLEQAMKRLDFQVETLGFTDDLAAPPLPIDLIVKQFPQGIYLQFLGAASQLIRQIEGDIIYAYKTKASRFGVGLLARQERRRPLVLDIDDWEMGWHGGDQWRYRPQVKQRCRDWIKPDGALRQPDHPIYLQQMEQLTHRADGITAQIVDDDEAIEKNLYKARHLVLAASTITDSSMTAKKILRKGESQQVMEGSFSLLKLSIFFTFSIFLKASERISAFLDMVRALAVIVYTLAQWLTRHALVQASSTIIGQHKRPSQMPSLRYTLQGLQAIYRAGDLSSGYNLATLHISKITAHYCRSAQMLETNFELH